MKKDELPRFNMPYELGLDVGAVEFGNKKLRQKRILILETDRYHYQKVYSDIAGQDIESHDNHPYPLITKVRNWFSSNIESRIVGQRPIWNAYNQFLEDLYSELKNEGYSNGEIESMPIGDFIKFAKDWVRFFFKTVKGSFINLSSCNIRSNNQII